jgi:hypothetical protein
MIIEAACEAQALGPLLLSAALSRAALSRGSSPQFLPALEVVPLCCCGVVTAI